MSAPHHGSLLPLRTAVILMTAVLVGAAAGLTCLVCKQVPEAVLAGAAAFGRAVIRLHKLIST